MDEDQIEAAIEEAVEKGVAAFRAAERSEERRLARLMWKLDLFVFIPVTACVIAIIVWLKLSIGPEAGMLTPTAGYALVRAATKRMI